MAIISTTATPETIGNLVTRVRRAVGDNDSVTSNQRWSTGEIVDAINLEFFKMRAEYNIGNNAVAMTSADLSYPADSLSVALPSGPDTNPIFMVEDVTDDNNHIRIEFASVMEADQFSLDGAYSWNRGYRWSRQGDNIAIRPVAGSGITLRIWYWRAPLKTSASYGETDQHAWPVAYEELISLGAAIRLQEIDGEIPPGRVERYVEQWQRFVRAKYQNRSPIYVRRNRRYR